MTLILFFATAADAAGTRRFETSATTVESALRDARASLGPGVAQALRSSRLWLNNNPVDPGDQRPFVVGDVIAVLPPVSGG